jgi:phospholipase/carboxylesterase
MNRRQFLGAVVGGVATGALLHGGVLAQERDARLSARHRRPSSVMHAGRHALTGSGTGSILYVPQGLSAASAVPLVMMLHGATRALPPLQSWLAEAERRKFVLAVPMAAQHTWDLMQRGYGNDVRMLDRSLAAIFDTTPIDTRKTCLAGFSDGGSYALSVGLQNGDVFTHIMAFSPGFIGPGTARGTPRVFVSHGTNDPILPIDATGRRVKRELERRKLALDYREFNGGHGVPPEMQTAALSWLLA